MQVRRRVSVLLAVVLAVAGAAGLGSGTASADGVTVLAPSTLGSDPAAVNGLAYSEVELAQHVAPGWTGDTATCNPGSIPASTSDAALRALNAYRKLEGLEPVALEAHGASLAQAAALIVAANNQLNHQPQSSAKCWTPEGLEGSMHSDLCFSGHPSLLVYMDDGGDPNVFVGHRQSFIYPYLDTVGYGATDSTDAVYINSTFDVANSAPEWLAWPTPGYFPIFMNPRVGGGHARWSLSSPDDSTDFGSAQVSMTGPGGSAVSLQIRSSDGGLMPTLVWDVAGFGEERDWTSPGTFRVSVTGIRRGGVAIPGVQYDVTLLPYLPRQILSAPRVTGAPTSGEVLSVTRGKYQPAGGVDYVLYQWLRDGQPIKKATGDEYLVQRADERHDLSVRVTVQSDNSGPVGFDYADTPSVVAIGNIGKGRLRVLTPPRLNWDREHPRYLTVTGPVLNFPTNRVRFIWYRDGVRIPQPKKDTLLVKGPYSGGLFRVKVTAKLKGYGSVKAKTKTIRYHG